jgi:hypothetical protein
MSFMARVAYPRLDGGEKREKVKEKSEIQAKPLFSFLLSLFSFPFSLFPILLALAPGTTTLGAPVG